MKKKKGNTTEFADWRQFATDVTIPKLKSKPLQGELFADPETTLSYDTAFKEALAGYTRHIIDNISSPSTLFEQLTRIAKKA